MKKDASGGFTLEEILRATGLGRATFYKYLQEQRKAYQERQQAFE